MNSKTNNFNAITLSALLILLWSIVTWWRVENLGFYSDDWLLLTNTIYFNPSLEGYLGANFYSRPVYGLIGWLFNLIANGSAQIAQIISSLIVLFSSIVAFLIYKHAANQFGSKKEASILGALFGALTLCLSPWALAVFVWSTGVLTLWGFILFGLGYLLIVSKNSNNLKRIIGSILVLCGYLAYEAYWFLFLPLLVINLNSKKIREVSYTLCWFVIPLGVTLIYQRLFLLLLDVNKSKPISFNFSLILNNFFYFIDAAVASVEPISKNYFLIFFILMILILWLLLSFKKFILIILATSLGVLISLIMYALVGYAPAGSGVMSRTMAVPSFYYSLLITIFISSAYDFLDKRKMKSIFKKLLFGLIALVICSMTLIGFFTRVQEWVEIKNQSTILLKALHQAINKSSYSNFTNNPFVVVAQIEGDLYGNIFGAYYELSGGVASFDYHLVPNANIIFTPAREGAWQTIWDGKQVIQGQCPEPEKRVLLNFPSTNAPLYFRIDPISGDLLLQGFLSKNNAFGCNGIKPLLD